MLMGVPQQPTIKLTPGNTKPRGRRSAPKAEEREIGKGKDPYAYTFKDKNLGEMRVLNTSNAWWLDPQKVEKIVDAYKFYATDEQACFYAGITAGQLEYFQKLHPDFFGIKHGAKNHPGLLAKKNIVGGMADDKGTAQWWLERTEKETFSPRAEIIDPGGRAEIEKLTEDLREFLEDEPNYDDDTNKEHTSDGGSGQPNAGQGGATDEAKPTADKAQAPPENT